MARRCLARLPATRHCLSLRAMRLPHATRPPHPVPGSLAISVALFGMGGCGGSEVGADEPDASHLVFVDVAPAAGIDVVSVSGDPRRWYILEGNGCGAAWLDHDGDGDQDLYVANGAGLRYHDDGARLEVLRSASSRLYRNDGGLRFSDVTDAAGARRTDWTNAVATADVEGDGDPDLYLAGFGADALLLNEGGRFAERTAERGLANELWAAGAAFADPDRDGDLDLYVANYCLFDPAAPPDGGRRHVIEGVEVGWGPEAENGQGFNPGAPDRYFRGNGLGGFTEATAAAGFELEEALCSYAAVFSDVDDDGWPDLLVANDMQPCNLFMNAGDGSFREEGVVRGFALGSEGRPTSAMGLFVEDVDGDGDPDVLKTNFDFEPNSLHLNDGAGNFAERAGPHGLVEASVERLGWGGGFLDADCDGDLDALVANGHVYPQAEQIGMHGWAQPTQLFEAVPDAEVGIAWHDVTPVAGPGLAGVHAARGVALGDPDDDGDVDALVVDLDAPPRLLENRSERRGHWITVSLVGAGGNRDALGAKVTVGAGGRTWTREMRTSNGLYSAHDPRLHFGLGPVTGIDWVEVRWPTGNVQRVSEPPLDGFLKLTEDED